jgi:UDP-N-acetyl-D-glucosamine dehydrogenase
MLEQLGPTTQAVEHHDEPMFIAKKLVVVGQGYVGLPIAMRAVEAGYDVVGLDTHQARITQLQNGSSYIEDVPDRSLRDALATGRFLATTDVVDTEGFDFAIITVPTPLRETLPDLSFIEKASADLAPYLKRGALVVLESTTYPGTTEELMAPILEAASGLKAGSDFHIGYSPERIDPGNKVYTFVTTPKVVSGIDAESRRAVEELYGTLVDTVVPVATTKEAELTKLLENTFRHVNIALVNELAMYARDLGVDIWGAIDAASTKPFGYMRFTPGPGVGGHCLPVDPSYLSWQVRRTLGHSFRFVELANDVNEHMPDYVVQRVISGLNSAMMPMKGSRVLLVGLSYKANTGDVRESPAVRVAELLMLQGCLVSACDPYVAQPPLAGLRLVKLDEAEVEAADAVVILTDHDDFDFDLVEAARGYVLDTRRTLSGRRESL